MSEAMSRGHTVGQQPPDPLRWHGRTVGEPIRGAGGRDRDEYEPLVGPHRRGGVVAVASLGESVPTVARCAGSPLISLMFMAPSVVRSVTGTSRGRAARR